MLALPHDMIGFSFTNAGSLVAPTYGRTAVLGTNPIAVAAPSGAERPYVLDMATSIVPVGKITVFERAGLEIPYGWGIDGSGQVSTDPEKVFHGGALMPLGGTAEMRGYKGYGLALMVEILAGLLAGAEFGTRVDPVDIATLVHRHCSSPARGRFRPLVVFMRDIDALSATSKTRLRQQGRREFTSTARRSSSASSAASARGAVLSPWWRRDKWRARVGRSVDLSPLGEIVEVEG